MSKSIKLKNNNYLDSNGIVHNHTLLSTLLYKLLKSNILYESSDWLTAGAEGKSVVLSEPVTNFGAIIIINKNGNGIVNTKLNQNNSGGGITIYWYNNGLHGTFYSNTIYKVIGIGRK